MSASASPDLRRRQPMPPHGITASADTNGNPVRIKKEPEEDIKRDYILALDYIDALKYKCFHNQLLEFHKGTADSLYLAVQDYAETTMNELLGWYGYDKVNTGETKGINLSLSRFSSSSSPPHEGSESEDGSRDTAESRVHAPDSNDSTAQLTSGGGLIECSWCSKSGLKLFTLKTAGGEAKAFCSELCFNQCRRATFKKSRICDWCKHVRHTVNYVDFQDGAHQLQFCGDKCLNQYKMHIFCKETQAYLQMHPHLQEVARSGGDSTSTGSKLITPDLWLRDCKDGVNGNAHGTSVHSDDDAEPGAGSSSTGEQDELFPVHRPSNITESKTSDNSAAFNIWEKIENHRKEFNKTAKGKDCSRRNGKQSTRNAETLSRRPVAPSVSPKPHHQQARVRSPLSPVHTMHVNGSAHARTSPNLLPPRIMPPSSPSLPAQPHSSSTSSSSSVPPGIPPPPPLINSELFRPPFPPHLYHPSFNYLSQQQQLEYFLRTHAGNMRMGMTPPPPPAHFPHPAFPSPFMQPPNPLSLASHSFGSNSLVPPPTIMIPYPVIIPLPLPIPIPIPIPLLGAAKKGQKSEDTSEHPQENSAERVHSPITETQGAGTPEDGDAGRDSTISSPLNQVEENILVDVVEVKETEMKDSECLRSSSSHDEGQKCSQSLPEIECEGQKEQPMAMTRSKSRNNRTHASPRESKRPRLMDRDGL